MHGCGSLVYGYAVLYAGMLTFCSTSERIALKVGLDSGLRFQHL